MTNAGQKRGGSSGLLRWALRGATIAFVALLTLFLITLAGFCFGYADKLADFFGHEKTDGLSAGGHFALNLGSALLVLGGIIVTAEWRNRDMSRQADAALNQADVALGQIKNESNRIAGKRFSDGIKMLAQNEGRKPAIAARVGGIYALQSLANNYIPQYAAQVVKTLVAYVKENAQLTKIPYKENSDMNFLGEDVKTAFSVLAQLLDGRDESPEKKFELSDNDLDFSDCDFSRLCLDDRQISGLRHYKWQGADLRGSDLHCADFKKAWMCDAQLQDADLSGAILEGAILMGADLRGTDLGSGRTNKTIKQTNLQGAILRYADLRGATFSGVHTAYAADLSCADLSDAKLRDTNLRFANLSGARLPELSQDQIWHSEQPELKGVKSIGMFFNLEWELKPYQNCPNALAGVLHNYATISDVFVAMSSPELLKAARKLLVENKLPPGFSEIWRKRLEEVDPETGDHPDWRAGE